MINGRNKLLEPKNNVKKKFTSKAHKKKDTHNSVENKKVVKKKSLRAHPKKDITHLTSEFGVYFQANK